MSVFQSEVKNADTVAGSKLAIVTTRLNAGVNLKIVEREGCSPIACWHQDCDGSPAV